jgi:hypothetical protein
MSSKVIKLDPKTAIEQGRQLEYVTGDFNPETATNAELDALAAEQESVPSREDDPFGWHVEPWRQPVLTAALLEEIQALLHRHIVVAPHYAHAIALWILFAWTHDTWETSPYLAFTSAEKESGKTSALSVVSRLVPNPLPAANISAASVFRAIEKWGPTLLIDEFDTARVGDDDGAALRGILNSGHSRGAAYVLRCVGKQHEVQNFSTWCPKVVAAIGALPDTLASRTINIRLKRRLPSEKIVRFRDNDAAARQLRRKAVRWAKDHRARLAAIVPVIPDGLGNRGADSWEPLCTVAALAGGEWPTRASKAALSMSKNGATDTSIRVRLLADIRAAFGDRDKLPTVSLINTLIEDASRPWAEWKNGKPISPRQLADMLRPFGIIPTTRREGEVTFKGYQRLDFEDAWSRYPLLEPSHGHNADELALSNNADP